MGCRTDPCLAQPKPPLGQGFRGVDRQRQIVGLHRLGSAADQEVSLTNILQSGEAEYIAWYCRYPCGDEGHAIYLFTSTFNRI
jgi:hypothetical protein